MEDNGISTKIENNKDLIERDEISNGENIIKMDFINGHHDDFNDIRKHNPKIESENFQVKKNDETNFIHKIGIKKTKNNKLLKKIEKFRIPKELKKTYIIVLILAFLGIILIICGCIKAISEHTPGGGLMFWLLGSIVITPGGFYSYQFYKAKNTKQKLARKRILDNIPQL